MTLRIMTSLGPELEDLITHVIGCCITVHRELGPGLLESIYRRALCIEFKVAGIPFKTEVTIPVTYLGQLLRRQRLDVLVDEKLLLEINAVDRIAPLHRAQVLGYLRASKTLRVGLLLNSIVQS